MSADFNKDMLHFRALPGSENYIMLQAHEKSALRCSTVTESVDAYSANETPSISSFFGTNTELHTNPLVDVVSSVSDRVTPRLNLRYRNMLNYPKYAQRKGVGFHNKVKCTGITTDPVYTLKLLCEFLQPLINREVNDIIRKYTSQFLTIAIDNIRFNLGEQAVSQHEVHQLQYILLKNATAQYLVAEPPAAAPPPPSRPARSRAGVCGTPSSSTAAAASSPSVPLRSSARQRRLRKLQKAARLGDASPGGGGGGSLVASSSSPFRSEEDTYEDAASPEDNAAKRSRQDDLASLRPSSTAGDVLESLDFGSTPGCVGGEEASSSSSSVGSETPGLPPQTTTLTTPSSHPVSDPVPHISPTDTFVLGSRANTWLGLGAARGSIYSKHPLTFRYACDRQDKMWLSRVGHLPKFGVKAFLMLANQVRQLADPQKAATPQQKRLQRDPLPEFTLPLWFFKKVLASTTTKPPRSRGPVPAAREDDYDAPRTINPNHAYNSSRSSTINAYAVDDRFAFRDEEEEEEEMDGGSVSALDTPSRDGDYPPTAPTTWTVPATAWQNGRRGSLPPFKATSKVKHVRNACE